MKNFSLKALGAIIFAAGLVAAGVVAPASAMNLNLNGSGIYDGSQGSPIFLYSTPNQSLPRVNFMESNAWSATYYLKLVGVETTLSSCISATYNVGSFQPSGATISAGFPTSTPGTKEFATSCSISSTSNGAQSSVIFSFNKTANAVIGSPAEVVIGTGVVSVNAAASDVKAYVSDDNTTWQLVGTSSNIGYAVTLDANGGSRNYGQSGTTVIRTNATNTWTAISDSTAGFIWGGHTFSGWTTDPQGQNTLYATSSSVPLSVNGTTLYAKWAVSSNNNVNNNNQNNNVNNNNVNNNNVTPCSSGTGSYMIQTLGNGGQSSTYGSVCLYRSQTASTVAPPNIFTKTGFNFTGWRTSQNVTYAVGDPVTATIGSPILLYAVWSANSSSNANPARPNATLGLTLNRGGRVSQAPVPVSASGLQPNAAYTVEVHSTPVIIASGNVGSDGTVNYTAAIPSGLEAGWHTLIFTSIAADGSSFTSNYYFKVSGDGTLLSTSETIPAELAYTGMSSSSIGLLLAGGLSLALVGAEMFMIARRKRSN